MKSLNLPKGKRLTKQRQIILDELRKVRSHPSAFEVFKAVKKRVPKISLGTVYRNLKFLQSHSYIMGMVCGCCDCEHFDGYTDHHEHFTCKICQKVYDLKTSIVKELNISKKDGHQIDDYQINLTGVCQKCLKRNHQIKSSNHINI